MKLFHFIFRRFLPVSKTSQANELEKIRQTQEHLAREMVRLRKELTELRKLIYYLAKQSNIYYGALVSAWLGLAFVLVIECFEFYFPNLKNDAYYIVGKPLAVVLISLIYLWRKRK